MFFWVKLSHSLVLSGEFEAMNKCCDRDFSIKYRDLTGNLWDGECPLIVFDGVCALCSGFVKWVIKRDKTEQFLFTTAQSSLGQSLFKHFQLDAEDFETNLVFHSGQVFMRMEALFAICRVLGWPWRFVCVFQILPGFLLDWMYERIKRNRYAMFGKYNTCILPEPRLSHRFIDC